MEQLYTLREMYEYITDDIQCESMLDMPLLIKNNGNYHAIQIIDEGDIFNIGDKDYLLVETPYYRSSIKNGE